MSAASDIVVEPIKDTAKGGLTGAKWGGLAGFLAGALVVGAAAFIPGALIGLAVAGAHLAVGGALVSTVMAWGLGFGAVGALAGGTMSGAGGAYTGGSWGLIGGAIVGVTKSLVSVGDTIGSWFGAKKQAEVQQDIDGLQARVDTVSAKEQAAQLHMQRAQSVEALGGTPEADPKFVAGLTNKQSEIAQQQVRG